MLILAMNSVTDKVEYLPYSSVPNWDPIDYYLEPQL